MLASTVGFETVKLCLPHPRLKLDPSEKIFPGWIRAWDRGSNSELKVDKIISRPSPEIATSVGSGGGWFKRQSLAASISAVLKNTIGPTQILLI